MIIGIGIDIADSERFRRAVESFGDRFLEKIFSPDEIACCKSRTDPRRTFATYFALKEAAMKALGIGLVDGALFREIEVVLTDGVEIRFSGNTLDKAKQLDVSRIHGSVAHERGMAIAIVVIEGE